ncbi:hypothetical protein BDZ91DRAFT_676548 [Kalaharituber pfeilii]|nr:hypothetical protein BDZ91DRAFT_676548 [Kalaharituber pfeilii]
MARPSKKRRACLLASVAAAAMRQTKKRAITMEADTPIAEVDTPVAEADTPIVYSESEQSLVDESEWDQEEEEQDDEQDIQDLSIKVDVHTELMRNIIDVDFSTTSSNINVVHKSLAKHYGCIRKLNKIYSTPQLAVAH